MVETAFDKLPLFSSKRMIMLLVDPEDGLIVDASKGALEFYGYSLEEIKALHTYEINIMKHDEVELEMQNAIDDKCNHFMFRHRKSNGVIASVEVSSEKVSINGKDLLFSHVQDVTQHQRYMADYVEMLQRYKAVFNQVGDMMLLLKVDDDYHPLKILEVNKYLIETMKYSEEELLTMPISQLLHSTAVEQFSQIGSELKQNGASAFYLEAINRYGNKIPVYVNMTVMDYDDKPVIVVSGKDLSIEFDLQMDLDIQENYYRALFSKSPHNIFLINEKNVVCDFNAAVIDYFCLDVKGILGNQLSSTLNRLSIEEIKIDEILCKSWIEDGHKAVVVGRDPENRALVIEIVVIPFSLPDDSRKAYVLLNDITEFAEKSNKTDLFSAVFSNNNEGVFVTNAYDKIEWVNHSFEKITGFSSLDAIGKTPVILKSSRHNGDFYKKIWYEVEEAGAWAGEVWARKKDGEDHPVQLSIFVMEDHLYQQKKYISIMSDLRKIKDQENKIMELAYLDALTGLKNRSYFMEELTQEISRAEESGHPFSVIYIDLDNFKVINETLGHTFGDEVLIQFSNCISDMFGHIGIVGRIGGDEFTVLLKEIAPSVLDYYFEQLVEILKRPFYVKDKAIRVLFSAGIAQYPAHGQTAEALLKNADIAMYKAKSYSGMSYMLYSEHYSVNMARDLYIENLVLSGIEREEFFMEYQPIVSRETKEIVGVEALVRWQTQDKGLISPSDLIPICEKNGTIKELGRWVLERSIKDLVLINSKLNRALYVAINVSTVQLFDETFVELLKKMIDTNIIVPDLIELEITETAYMQDFTRMKEMLKRLKSLGVKIVIDDFGTGYSSFNQLIHLEVDKLKIDQSFIREIELSNKHLCLVKGILMMAENLNIGVVCEGIEMSEQLQRMNDTSWCYGQGFLFAKPVKMEKFLQEYVEITEELTILLD